MRARLRGSDGDSRHGIATGGLGRVVKVEPNDPTGLRLNLATGVVLTVGPPGSHTLVQTATGPDSLAIYEHSRG
jgi:hypothetical protein